MTLYGAARKFRDAFHCDPGHSDLDREQPIHITVTLGDWRDLNYALNTHQPEERATIPEGWTLVPKIANVEMLAELASGITLLVRDQAPAHDLPTLLDRYQGAYTAMLKKASPPPQRVPEGHKDV